jgi:hypothetical protein
MGLFDQVVSHCGYCGGDIAWQSKAALDPALRVYPVEAVPLAMAADLDGQWAQCTRCGKCYQLVVQCGLPSAISMSLRS